MEWDLAAGSGGGIPLIDLGKIGGEKK